MPRDDTIEHCWYCDRPVARAEAEKDHFPIPARHGGDAVVWACKGCHSLKDRLGLQRIEMLEYIGSEWHDWPPSARIFMARIFALLLDVRKLEGVEG